MGRRGRMKFTTLVPIRLNDGSATPAELLNEIEIGLAVQFGGCTNEGLVRGYWHDEQGQRFHDESYKISVVCENERYQEAVEAVISIGKRLGQLAMYFEVRDFDGVRFLKMPE